MAHVVLKQSLAGSSITVELESFVDLETWFNLYHDLDDEFEGAIRPLVPGCWFTALGFEGINIVFVASYTAWSILSRLFAETVRIFAEGKYNLVITGTTPA
jgi:hypothetical protein